MQRSCFGLNLEEYFDAAVAWCKSQGVEKLADIKEAEVEQDFVDALNITFPVKAKLMVKRLGHGEAW